MTQDRDPKVSYRMPQERLDAIDALAEKHNVARSALLRQFDAYGLESNAEAIGIEAEIANLKQEIVDFGRPIDDAGGFSGRVRHDFEKRFKNGYGPKWLAAKAESYRREARMLEQKVPEHPDSPPIEDGELVEEVDRVLRNTLEAAKLSDWSERYSNPLERLSGVESGRRSREFALLLTRNALKMDRDLEPLRSTLSSERRVQPSDLPELADEELPPSVDRDDVARVARELADQGVTPESLDTDPTEFDPFGWIEAEAEAIEADAPDALPVADGGDNEAIVSYAEESDERDIGDLVEWAAEKLRDADLGDLTEYEDWKAKEKRRKARRNAETQIEQTFETDVTNWQTEIMDRSNLTPDELIEAADDYNDATDAALTGERDTVPEAVATANGGVRLE